MSAGRSSKIVSMASVSVMLVSVALASCGLLSDRDVTRRQPAATTSTIPVRVSATSATGVDATATAIPSPETLGTPPTETIGFDVLAEGTVADPQTIGALAYGILAAADPYRITIPADEQACLSAASSGLTDEQIDDALAWDDSSGNFAEPVSGCLRAPDREAFAVWHQIDIELADADDHQYRCVEQGLAGGATQHNLDVALAACGVQR